MVPTGSSPPRLHLADPASASALARAVLDGVGATIDDRPRRRATFERLRGRVSVRAEGGAPGGDGLVGLVFDRGTLVVWDGPPPGGAQVALVLSGELRFGPQRRWPVASTVLRRRLRLAGAVRHPRLATGAVSLLHRG